tara:strand:+ start:235 stop:729 length:495 start_codon:yes stop_codon:yes gene_type:complete
MFSSRHSLNILFLFIFILSTSQSFSETISFKGLVLSNFWIKNVIANSKTTSGYIKIENKNEKNERLISVESNFSKRTELHYMNIKNDIMIMKHLEDGFLIKSKSQINLKPGSFHIMFIDLTKSFNKTSNQKVKFNFENAGSIIINMPIINKAKISKDKKKHHHH